MAAFNSPQTVYAPSHPNNNPSSPGVNTTVIVHVFKAGGTNPVVNATVQLTNTALVPKVTDASGHASFSSVDMPEAVDLLITFVDSETMTVDNQAVLQGEENVIEVPVL